MKVGLVDVAGDVMAQVKGIKRCGSPWACPVCAPKIREGRASDIDRGLRAALEAGYACWFVSVTVPHAVSDSLASSFDLLRDAHRVSREGRKWVEFKEQHAVVGTIRAWEITHGRSGWHPHAHEVWILDPHQVVRALGAEIDAVAPSKALVDEQRAAIRSHLEQTYGRVVAGERKALHGVHGIDVRPIVAASDLAGYLTKIEQGWGAGLEMARSDIKRGRGKGRSPFELLEAAYVGDDRRAAVLWDEYAETTCGKQAIRWSAGLRKLLLGDEPEKTNEQLAEAELAGELLWEIFVPADDWYRMLRAGVIGLFLEMCEDEYRPRAGAPPPAVEPANLSCRR